MVLEVDFMCFSRADYILRPHIMIHLGLQQLESAGYFYYIYVVKLDLTCGKLLRAYKNG